MDSKRFLCLLLVELLVLCPPLGIAVSGRSAWAAGPGVSTGAAGKATPDLGLTLTLDDLADNPAWGLSDIVTRLDTASYETFRVSGRVTV